MEILVQIEINGTVILGTSELTERIHDTLNEKYYMRIESL